MTISMYDTRRMLRVLEQRKAPKTFLRDTFINEVALSDAETVDIDIIKNKRRMAPFCHPNSAGKPVLREGFATNSYKPAYIKPFIPTTAGDVLARSAGETIYSAMTPEQRAAQLLGKDMATLDEMITRREEWMVAQALFTGQLPVVGDGVDYVIDFGFDADAHKIALSTGSKWGDTGIDPHADMRAWRRALMQRSGLTPNIALMGSGAVDVFLASLPANLMDYRRVDLGQIVPQALPNGVTYWGYIRDSAVDVFSYDEWYLGDDGIERPMVPTNAVLLASTQARCIMHYGCIKDLNALYAVERFPKSWIENNPSMRILQMQSAPLFNPVQVDGFMVITVK